MRKTYEQQHDEHCRLTLVGEWWDDYRYIDPHTGQVTKEYSTPVKRNVKMDGALLLIAALLKGEAGISGLLYHAQGRGDGAWTDPPPAVSTSDTTLLDEAGRKTPTSIVFLDGADMPTATITNVLRVSTTLLTSDLVGETLREQALFGGDATAAVDTGIILNLIRHAPIFKSGAFELTRNIKLTLT